MTATYIAVDNQAHKKNYNYLELYNLVRIPTISSLLDPDIFSKLLYPMDVSLYMYTSKIGMIHYS